jgi:hypothetical protein
VVFGEGWGGLFLLAKVVLVGVLVWLWLMYGFDVGLCFSFFFMIGYL